MHRSCVKRRIIQHSLYANQQGSMDFSLGQVVSGFAVEVRRDLAFKMSGTVSEGADVRALQLEILRLETKLKDLHSTDTVANKRALETLRQHVRALNFESQGISESISGLDVDPFSQKVVEEELGALSAAALATYITDRLIKASRLLDSGELRGVVWILSGTYVAWRMTFGVWRKLKARIGKNVRCQEEIQVGYKKVAERIEVMGQLLPPENGSSGV